MTLKLFAPAKINLTLDVLGKRTDGYHELETIMQTISLGDTVELSEAFNIGITCNQPEVPSGLDNLAYQAAALISRYAGVKRGVHIHIHKRIPVAAGLAGGSTDAAAVLRGLNKLWQLNYSYDILHNLAATLGSDVAFCLRGGTALGKGRGEQLTPLTPIPTCGVVLVKPPFAVSTKDVYTRYNTNVKQPPMTETMIKALQTANRRNVMEAIGNMLERTTLSLHPEISNLKAELLSAGAEAVLMSGSGPTIFGLTDSIKSARLVAQRMPKEYIGVFVAETVDRIGEEGEMV